MGIFEKAGKRFEQFKQAAEGAAEAEAEYECGACGALFYTDRDQCQECGADEVVPVETAAEDSDAPENDERE